MSQMTGDDSPLSQSPVHKTASAGPADVLVTPVRRHLDELLAEAGWQYSDLTPQQIRMLASLVSDRQTLLRTVQSLNEELENIRSHADHDSLVPVYNRRAFHRELTRQLSFCHRYETSACLIYIDLDRFKEINDRYGHSTGDMALRKFGEILSAHTRESDIVGRLGGDEFAVLLINADEKDGNQKADRFRDDVAKLRFGHASAALGFGLSCGVAAWQRGESADALINRADEAMYREKRPKSGNRLSPV